MSQYVLEILDGDRAGEVVPLDRGRIAIGRKPTNDLVLTDEKVSGQHAELVHEEGRWVLRDLGSTNGTLLDGRRVEEVALSPFDTFQIGRLRVQLKEPGAAEPVDAVTVHRVDQERLARSRRRHGVLGLVVMVVVLAAVAAWAWLQDRGRGEEAVAGGGAREIPRVAGNKLDQDSASVEDLAGWSLGAGGDGFDVGGPAHSGATALQASGAEAGGAGWALARTAEPVPVLAGQAMDLIGYVRTAGGARAALRLRFSSSVDERAPVLHAARAPAAAEGWQRHELAATVPAGMDRVEVEVVALLPGAEAEVVADDLALVSGTGGTEPLPALEARAGPAQLVGTPVDVAIRSADGPVLTAVVPAVERGALAAMAEDRQLTLAELGATLGVEAQTDRFRLRVDGGVSGLALHFPVSAAAAGVRVRADEGPFVLHAGDLEAVPARELLLGSGATRLVVALPEEAAVDGARVDDDYVLRLAGIASVELVVGFEEERVAGQEALQTADAHLRAGEPGQALDVLREVVERTPHDDDVLARAERQRTEILRALRRELEVLREELAEADFFRARRAYERIGERLHRLVRTHGEHNLPDREAVRAMQQRVDTALAELDAARNAERREALLELAQILGDTGDTELAAVVRGYVERHLGGR